MAKCNRKRKQAQAGLETLDSALRRILNTVSGSNSGADPDDTHQQLLLKIVDPETVELISEALHRTVPSLAAAVEEELTERLRLSDETQVAAVKQLIAKLADNAVEWPPNLSFFAPSVLKTINSSMGNKKLAAAVKNKIKEVTAQVQSGALTYQSGHSLVMRLIDDARANQDSLVRNELEILAEENSSGCVDSSGDPDQFVTADSSSSENDEQIIGIEITEDAPCPSKVRRTRKQNSELRPMTDDDVNADVVVLAGTSRTLMGERFARPMARRGQGARKRKQQPSEDESGAVKHESTKQQAAVKTQVWYIESRQQPNHLYKFARATVRPSASDRLSLICTSCKRERERYTKLTGTPSNKTDNCARSIVVKDNGTTYPLWAGQPAVEQGHHPQCWPRPWLLVAVDEANRQIQEDVNQDDRVLYLAHKKYMHDVFVRASERGYSRAEIMAELPWCIAQPGKRRRSKMRSSKCSVNKDAPGEKERPAVAQSLVDSLSDDGYLPLIQYNKLREKMQREAAEPYSLDDRPLDEYLNEKSNKQMERRQWQSDEFYIKGHNAAPLPGKYGAQLWHLVGRQAAQRVTADMVERVDDNSWLIRTPGTSAAPDDQEAAAAAAAANDQPHVLVTRVMDEGRLHLTCTCDAYVHKYLCFCIHTRHVARAEHQYDQHKFCVRTTIRSDHDIYKTLMELQLNTFGKPREGCDVRVRHGEPSPMHNYVSVPLHNTTSVTLNIPNDLIILASEWHIIQVRSEEIANSDAVTRLPDTEGMFVVLVDRAAFTVQRHGHGVYECNCDQMAALCFVCMHAAAVARRLLEFAVLQSVAEQLLVDDAVEPEDTLFIEDDMQQAVYDDGEDEHDAPQQLIDETDIDEYWQ